MSIAKINAVNVNTYGRIASGKRINRAADDAAGMAIANKLKANRRGMYAATDNTKQGIDVTKIADGAYDSIMERLQGIRELAVKAMNGTNSASDKQIIQDEINQQMMGIDESARNTMYNEMKLLDSNYATMEIASNPTGKGSEIQLTSARLEALGISGFDVTGEEVDLDMIDRAIEKVSSDRSRLGAQANRMAASVRVNDVAYENLTAAQSRIEDLEMGQAVSDLKKDQTMESVQIAMFKKQREQEANVTKIF